MRHRKARGKLNLKQGHKRAFVRNQAITFIENGSLTTTKTNAKETQRFVEKLVTIAREGNNFNARRRAKQLLPYKDEALVKLFTEIAPKYKERAGGYTRVLSLGRRMQDTAPIATLLWVE